MGLLATFLSDAEDTVFISVAMLFAATRQVSTLAYISSARALGKSAERTLVG